MFIKAPANNGGQFASRTMPRRPVDQVCSSSCLKSKHIYIQNYFISLHFL